MKRLLVAMLALAGLLLLAGCGRSAGGFAESASTPGGTITLKVDPLRVGQNHLTIVVENPAVTQVDAQIIMASMGHGQVVKLAQSTPGTFSADTGAISMEGPWLVRVTAGTGSGEPLVASFRLSPESQ